MSEPKKKTRESRKKTAAILIAAALGVCVVGLFFLNTGDLTFDFDFLFEPEETVQYVYSGDGVHRISLYEPDWDSNILEDPEYLDKNRYITYVDGGLSITIVDEDYSDYGEPVELLANYLNALIMGDAELANSYFADSYFDENSPLDKITMQKLYNISIEYIARADKDLPDLGNVTQYVYKLSYMIMENDGTFRSDVTSDAIKPQFYTIIETSNGLEIYDVDSYYDPFEE
ncbi:MAG TPA: hypothetical protein H9681_01725 [Firmicutes bacterium]|nr:hypothetical protein [Bacillota bacterium]